MSTSPLSEAPGVCSVTDSPVAFGIGNLGPSKRGQLGGSVSGNYLPHLGQLGFQRDHARRVSSQL